MHFHRRIIYLANYVSEFTYLSEFLYWAFGLLYMMEVRNHFLVGLFFFFHRELFSYAKLNRGLVELQIDRCLDLIYLGTSLLLTERQNDVVKMGAIEDRLDNDLIELPLFGGHLYAFVNQIMIESQDKFIEEGLEGF